MTGTRFVVLGSGSGGNASLLEAEGFGLLIDAGLGPRQIAGRLASVGRSWGDISAAILTHVHSDHWKEPTLRRFSQTGVRLHCHARHADHLRRASESFRLLEERRLVTFFEPDDVCMKFPATLSVRPFAVSHDGGPTFGFRIDWGRGLFTPAWSLAYAADLGCWNSEMVSQFSDVDVLAVEFNHDVELQRSSGRHPDLIDRVLGDEGHLSNEQAAGLLTAVLGASPTGRLCSVAQLHLSRDCNRPPLAQRAASRALREGGAEAAVQTAKQHAPVEVTTARV